MASITPARAGHRRSACAFGPPGVPRPARRPPAQNCVSGPIDDRIQVFRHRQRLWCRLVRGPGPARGPPPEGRTSGGGQGSVPRVFRRRVSCSRARPNAASTAVEEVGSDRTPWLHGASGPRGREHPRSERAAWGASGPQSPLPSSGTIRVCAASSGTWPERYGGRACRVPHRRGVRLVCDSVGVSGDDGCRDGGGGGLLWPRLHCLQGGAGDRRAGCPRDGCCVWAGVPSWLWIAVIPAIVVFGLPRMERALDRRSSISVQ